jgi:hypothetical protein
MFNAQRILFFCFVFLGMSFQSQSQGQEGGGGIEGEEIQKLLKTVFANVYDPLDYGVLSYKHKAEFTIEKPLPVFLAGEITRKKGGEGEIRITAVEPQEFEPLIKPFEQELIRNLERINLPRFMKLFEAFDFRLTQNEEGLKILAGKAKGDENRALKVFIEDGFVVRMELLILIPNRREPENPRKIQTVQEFRYKDFGGVKVIGEMKWITQLGELEARFEYKRIEGYIFPHEVLTKAGPLETSYLYSAYELEVETGEF